MRYTKEHIDFIREKAVNIADDEELTKMFNDRFGVKITTSAIANVRIRYKIAKKRKICTRKNASGAIKISTLCWDCAKLDCSWAKKFEPVEGWEATKTKLKITGSQTVPSYIVHKCPDFTAESEDKQAFRKLCGAIDVAFYRSKGKKYSKILVSDKVYKTITGIMKISNFEEIFGLTVEKNKYVKDWRLQHEYTDQSI